MNQPVKVAITGAGLKDTVAVRADLVKQPMAGYALTGLHVD